MEVGLVVPGSIDQLSGGYRYDRELVSVLEAHGDNVTVVSLPREVAREPALETPPRDGPDEPGQDIRDRLDRPDDVLLQDELCYPLLAAVNPTLERPRTIVTLVHLLESARPADDARSNCERTRNREQRYLESVDGAIATSEFTRDRTTDLASIPTTVAPPAGRHEGCAVSSGTVRKRSRTGPLSVLFLGNLVPRKNLLGLVDALERVEAAWHLTVVGDRHADPATVRRVHARVDSLGIRDRVSFSGTVDDATLESIFERAHVLAVPSRYEGFGMCYLEAMEYGVVPIASTVGGASEFVADGHNGYLVAPDDEGRLVSILDRLATDRDHLATRGCRALATAEAYPDWETTLTDARAFLRTRLEET